MTLSGIATLLPILLCLSCASKPKNEAHEIVITSSDEAPASDVSGLFKARCGSMNYSFEARYSGGRLSSLTLGYGESFKRIGDEFLIKEFDVFAVSRSIIWTCNGDIGVLNILSRSPGGLVTSGEATYVDTFYKTTINESGELHFALPRTDRSGGLGSLTR